MHLATLDLVIIFLFFALTMAIGLYASRRAGKSSKEFFLSGRDMPWWLLGVSMVATTFSADTPNFVTNVVRTDGVSGNWVWWAFLLTGMTTVFIYAKLWRRSGITTDLEFYQLRYSGAEATFLRGFRAVYLGVVFNVLIMAGVLLAGNKIAAVMLGLSPVQTVLLVGIVTVVYSSLGGLRGVILTDFFQFILSMGGMIIATLYVLRLPEVGGLSSMMAHPAVAAKSAFFPDMSDSSVAVPLLLVPLAVQWWSTWYPGAEPGGGGYVAQRMLSAKDESDATKATLLFTIAHYALRPWPWILIAMASLLVFPNLASLRAAFPHVDPKIVADDLAFPAMLSLLPSGLLGLLIAALIAALMSTISTHLNWGASYMVSDFYVKFIRPDASDRKQVFVGRLWTVVLMLLAGIVALYLQDAKQAFEILLQIGAGTGLLFLLRWFWWRINAYSEIAAMAASLLVACYFTYVYEGDLLSWQRLLISVGVTTVIWLAATLFTRPTAAGQLDAFYRLIKPHGPGWQPVAQRNADVVRIGRGLATEVLMVFIACIMVYAALFGTGYLLYGQYVMAGIAAALVLGTAMLLVKMWR